MLVGPGQQSKWPPHAVDRCERRQACAIVGVAQPVGTHVVVFIGGIDNGCRVTIAVFLIVVLL